MSVFSYHAVDARQEPHSGTIAADSPALARQALRGRGLWVTSIASSAVIGRTLGQRLERIRMRRSRRGNEQVAELWRNLAVLLEAGVPLADALSVCLRQQSGPIQTVLRQLHDSVRNGQSFGDALAAHEQRFDELALSVVRVGERSGTLAAALRELADYQSRRRAIANRLGTALIYPFILCLVGSAVVIFLMGHVVPQLVEVLAAAGHELPAPTRVLKAISDGVVRHGAMAGLVATGLLAAGAAWRRTQRGKRFCERCVLAIPLLGDLVRKSWVARISMMLATLLRSDVRFVDALATVRAGIPHRLYAEELERLGRAVEAGAGIAEPLRDSRLIPPLVVHLLGVGQESGELPRMLDRLRDSYEKEVELAIARFLAVLEPALIVVLGVVIGFVVFATLLPILETTRIVQ